MIGTEEPMALVINNGFEIIGVCYLGYATLEAGEFSQLDEYIGEKYSLMLIEADEAKSMTDIFSQLKAMIYQG